MLPLLPEDAEAATLVFRVWSPMAQGPVLAKLRGDHLVDITSRTAPTMRDLLELADPVAHVRAADGPILGDLQKIAEHSGEMADLTQMHLLAPADLQAVKAAGVTFANSTLERVIEEQAKGDPGKADAVRARCTEVLGDSLRNVTPGSDEAAAIKDALIAENVWSQYLEVAIGPDAEVFSKAQPMSSVGWGAAVGLHPRSVWNNPEPEVVLACSSNGRILGATLGNDVNLRDFEGRSALLLSKAKDNNASCAMGPALRLFDQGYSLDDVRGADLTMIVEGTDGYRLDGFSSMTEISRDPADIVGQTCGRHHQYPDGFFLFLGTLFAPTEDRDEPGGGFTHHLGDVVTIANPQLGALVNTVRLSTECPEWTFGTARLMRNLAGRGLI